MLWIAGIALILGVFRSLDGLLIGVPVITLVAAAAFTYGSVRKINRELTASRREAPTLFGRAIEIGLLVTCGLGMFLLILMIGVVILVLGIVVSSGFLPQTR